MLLADVHDLDGFVLRNFENVEELRLGLAVLHELDDFVDSTGVGADVEDFELLIAQLIAYSGLRNGDFESNTAAEVKA